MFPVFSMKTPIVFGWGSLASLGEHIPGGDAVIVTGSPSERQRELVSTIGDMVDGTINVFAGVEPNPSEGTIARGAAAIREANARLIIAVGGGSVIDAAKAMAIVASQGGDIMDYVHGRKTPAGLGYPLFAIPTTPGTSSEITPFTVVSSTADRNKLALRHPSLYPDLALIDPSLTVPLPPMQTASTGMDIMSHAFESYWSRRSTPITREMSLTSVRLLVSGLEKAFSDGSNRMARHEVSLASIYAGLAFSNAGTSICHALSYPITYDTGLPHGLACALSLPGAFGLFVRKDPEYMEPLANAFGTSPEDLPEELRAMVRRMGGPTDLAEAGFHGGVNRLMDTDMALMRNTMWELEHEDMISLIATIIK